MSKKQTWTLLSEGKSLLSTPFRHVAEEAVLIFFGELKGVQLRDNMTNKNVQRWIYGRKQK